MAKKPSAKQVAADQERYHTHMLESVLGQFMGMDGAKAVGELTRMFGQAPRLLELNGKPIDGARDMGA